MTVKSKLSSARIRTDLEALLGVTAIVTDPGRMGAFLNEPRKRFFQTAVAVALPSHTAEVQTLARWANENRVPLIPQGGNTGLVGGQVPVTGNEVIVSLTRMNAIRSVNADAGNMEVEAGLTLEEAQAAADRAGALLPLTLASQGSARIGGVLSSNAGGVQVLAYGNARAMCLGVEAVLADGRIYPGLNALYKDNTGYDLKDLLIGSEGTLAILTAATLRLFPRPALHETAWISVDSPAAAYSLFAHTRDRAWGALTAFELMPRLGIDLQLKHKTLDRDPAADMSPWYVLAELSLSSNKERGTLESILAGAINAEIIANAFVAESLDDRALMWRAREQMSEIQTREGGSIKHDVSVPVAAVPELIERGCAAVARIDAAIRPCPFGHMGDGNIHFNFTQPEGADKNTFMAGAEPVHEAIYNIVQQLGGSFSAEHGIGQLKTSQMKKSKDPVALEMMRAIKNALDPHNILNPGKLLD